MLNFTLPLHGPPHSKGSCMGVFHIFSVAWINSRIGSSNKFRLPSFTFETACSDLPATILLPCSSSCLLFWLEAKTLAIWASVWQRILCKPNIGKPSVLQEKELSNMSGKWFPCLSIWPHHKITMKILERPYSVWVRYRLKEGDMESEDQWTHFSTHHYAFDCFLRTSQDFKNSMNMSGLLSFEVHTETM